MAKFPPVSKLNEDSKKTNITTEDKRIDSRLAYCSYILEKDAGNICPALELTECVPLVYAAPADYCFTGPASDEYIFNFMF